MTREEIEQAIIERAAKDPEFLAALRKDPKAALELELKALHQDIAFPPSMKVNLVEESANQIYLRLPLPKPDRLTDDELMAVAGGTGPQEVQVLANNPAVAVVDALSFTLTTVVVSVIGG